MCILYQGNMHRGNVEALGGLHLPRLRGKFVEWRKRKGGCGPRAVAVMLVDVISSCRVGGRILCALDEVELLNKQDVHGQGQQDWLLSKCRDGRVFGHG